MHARLLSQLSLAAVLAALATWGCAPGAGGGGGARSGRPARDHVRRCFELIGSDMAALKSTFPELAGWRAETVTAAGLEYVHKGGPAPGAGQTGACRVWVSVQPHSKDWSGSRHEFPSLGLEVRYEVDAGKPGNKAFVRRIQEIIRSRLTPLRDLDQVAGTCLKGIAADPAAVKGKYPELADWKADVLGGNRIHYVSGARTIDVEVRLGPSSEKSDYDFPFYVRTELGADASGGLAAEIRAIVQKNLQLLREFDRCTGGWLTR